LSLSVNPLPNRLDRIAHELGRELQLEVGRLSELWYERMAATPELERWLSLEVREGSLENARRDIGREIAGLLDGRTLPDSCPQEVIDSAQLAAASGFPLWACVQAYRAGHAVQWQAWSDAVGARRLSRTDRQALLGAGSEYMFAYADRCSRWIEQEYTRERDRLLRSEEQVRIQLVRDLLDGKHGDSEHLGYDLDGWHIAVLAFGRDADRVLRELNGLLRGQLLSVAADAVTWWGWIRIAPMRPGEIDRALQSLSLPAGISLAVGDPRHGANGFRQSHRQARYAALIGARRDQAQTSYDDVALEALATADTEQARSFVSRELGPLAGDDRRAETLRNTLRTYFAVGQTGSSTAHVLGVHERTIGNRLRAAEKLIGRSVVRRRAELETALRIHALLQADDALAKSPSESRLRTDDR
jgi:GGDEF-like domain/PucR C-terminal helix-turn-helix domain